jgi:hypothetical protein
MAFVSIKPFARAAIVAHKKLGLSFFVSRWQSHGFISAVNWLHQESALPSLK